MTVLKVINTIKYYYESNNLYLYGEKEKYKVKVREDEYIEIHDMISELQLGAKKTEILHKYRKYQSLLEFLIDKGLAYSICSKVLDRHINYEYFPWVEGASSNIEQDLKRLSNLTFMLPQEHIATPILVKKCEDFQIDYQLYSKKPHFLVYEDQNLLSSYCTYQNERNEIVISPQVDKNYQQIHHLMIADKIVAQFIFYTMITSIINERSQDMFFITEELEVIKKEYFTLQKETAEMNLVESKTEKNAITALNALELFIKQYESTISSFNRNEDYHNYLQMPIQVFTAQWRDQDMVYHNEFLADINYERLAKFMVEILFVEILRKQHHQDLSILQGSRVIHTARKKELDTDEYYNLIEDDLPELEMIQSLLKQENQDLKYMIGFTKDHERVLYIKDLNTNQYYQFNYPISNKEYIPLMIYTWINARKNNILLEQANYTHVSLNESNIKGMITFDAIQNGRNEIEKRMENLNINAVLNKLDFGYQIMEV